jgi:hypothetical protein
MFPSVLQRLIVDRRFLLKCITLEWPYRGLKQNIDVLHFTEIYIFKQEKELSCQLAYITYPYIHNYIFYILIASYW